MDKTQASNLFKGTKVIYFNFISIIVKNKIGDYLIHDYC
jgi:hypothetical protein